MSRRNRGFSLTELVIVLALAALLTVIALPSLRNYTVRTNRSVARTVLTDLSRAQDAYFLQAHSYNVTFDNLIATTGGATTVYFDRERVYTTSSTNTSIYSVQLCADCSSTCAAPTTTSFGVLATAVNTQTTDSSCPTLCLTNTGVKTPSPASSDCWNR